jgi:hypothetical protein
MVYFQTKNPNWGKFWRVLQWNIHIGIHIVCPFGRFYGHLVYFLIIWYISPVSVCCRKKNLAALSLTLTCWVQRPPWRA